jgi:PiT family inorganic phosphate transporter
MGSGITRLAPVGGFCAETAAATTIIGATFGHIPISTTHSITGAILGVGTMKGVRSVRWVWGQRILTAWILTMPCAAFVGGATYLLIHLILEPLLR